MLRRTIPAALLAAALGAAVPVNAQTPAFGARGDLAAGHAPRAVAVADVSGDGYPDLIFGGTNPGTVTILQNMGREDSDNGDRFQAPRVINVGGGPFDLAVGDLNRDGKNDIAVANADSNAVTLLFGTGRGFFGSPIDVPVAENPRGIALGDFNRDGIPDIIVTKYAGTTLEILYGAGNGTFPTRRSLAAPTVSQGVAVADFNNDGWLDAAVASTNGTIGIYSMTATGATRHDARPTGDGWNVIVAVDLDGNGRIDVVTASSSSSIVSGMYNFSFGWGAINPVSVAASPRGIAAGDVNGDGHPEIVVAGRAASMVSVVTRVDAATLTATDFAAGSGSRAVALADLTGDGRLDILTGNEYGNSASELVNTTTIQRAAFAFDRFVLPYTPEARIFGVADFNHNGKPDIVRANYVFFDGTTQSRYLGIANQAPSSSGAMGDFNRDGNPDVIYRFGDTLRMFFGNGAQDFTNGPSTSIAGAGNFQTADFNRDGRLDLLVSIGGYNVPYSLMIYTGRGDGTFTPGVRLDGQWFAYEIGDVNGDGVVDIVASSENGVSVFFNNGAGVITQGPVFEPGTPRYGLALGDLNEDGRLDLVAIDPQTYDWGYTTFSSVFTVARGNGDGTFEAIGKYDTDAGDYHDLYSLTIGDVDGDGHLDVFTSHSELYPGTGVGDLRGPERFNGQAFWRTVLADVNGDGLLDALGYNDYTSGDIVEMVMLNTRRTQNRPPAGLNLPDRVTWPYDRYWWDTDENEIAAYGATDPDLHAVRYRWTLADGTVVSTFGGWTPKLPPGTYQVTVTVDDYRGASISDTFTLDVPPFKETVLIPAQDARLYGAWQRVNDPTAAQGTRVWHPNAGAPKQVDPLANPTNFIELQFLADPTQSYKLWIRMKAEGDNWANDSVFVQFTGAKNASGQAIYEIGTTSALAVNLEECSNCGVSGWGWEDDGWGAVNRNGTTVRFPEGGPQTIRIQTREDGVSIDQIVLSSEQYLTARPGKAKNDTTILPHKGPELSPPIR